MTDFDEREGPGATFIAPGPLLFLDLAVLGSVARPDRNHTPLPDHFSRNRRAVSGLKILIAR
jgi:hypothetical protein